MVCICSNKQIVLRLEQNQWQSRANSKSRFTLFVSFSVCFSAPFPFAASSACRTEHGDLQGSGMYIYTKTRLFLPLRLTFQPRVPVFGFSPATWMAKGPLSAPKLHPRRLLHRAQAGMTSCGRTHDVETRQVKSRKRARDAPVSTWIGRSWLGSSPLGQLCRHSVGAEEARSLISFSMPSNPGR